MLPFIGLKIDPRYSYGEHVSRLIDSRLSSISVPISTNIKRSFIQELEEKLSEYFIFAGGYRRKKDHSSTIKVIARNTVTFTYTSVIGILKKFDITSKLLFEQSSGYFCLFIQTDPTFGCLFKVYQQFSETSWYFDLITVTGPTKFAEAFNKLTNFRRSSYVVDDQTEKANFKAFGIKYVPPEDRDRVIPTYSKIRTGLLVNKHFKTYIEDWECEKCGVFRFLNSISNLPLSFYHTYPELWLDDESSNVNFSNKQINQDFILKYSSRISFNEHPFLQENNIDKQFFLRRFCFDTESYGQQPIYGKVSTKDVSYDFIQSHPEIDWNMERIFSTDKLPIDVVKKYLSTSDEYTEYDYSIALFQNEKFTMDEIMEIAKIFPKLGCQERKFISKRKDLTLEFIRRNKTFKWTKHVFSHIKLTDDEMHELASFVHNSSFTQCMDIYYKKNPHLVPDLNSTSIVYAGENPVIDIRMLLKSPINVQKYLWRYASKNPMLTREIIFEYEGPWNIEKLYSRNLITFEELYKFTLMRSGSETIHKMTPQEFFAKNIRIAPSRYFEAMNPRERAMQHIKAEGDMKILAEHYNGMFAPLKEKLPLDPEELLEYSERKMRGEILPVNDVKKILIPTEVLLLEDEDLLQKVYDEFPKYFKTIEVYGKKWKFDDVFFSD